MTPSEINFPKKTTAVFLAVFSFVLILSITWRPGLQVDPQIKDLKRVKIAGVILETELVLTSEEQARGLSGREDLARDKGMLFVFDHSGRYPFWMKDMNFPIDIIWIGEDRRVVHIKKDARPESYPETFMSVGDARYVLEVISGFSAENNLEVGDRVEFLSP